MSDILLYGIACFICCGYCTCWLMYFRIEIPLNPLISSILVLKSIYLLMACFREMFDQNVLTLVCYVLYQMQVSFLYYFFMRVSEGALLLRNSSKLLASGILVAFNIALILYFINKKNFGAVLVIGEGFVFLYLVNRTLVLLEIINTSMRNHIRYTELTRFHTYFLLFIYIYFVNDMIKICLVSIYERFSVDIDSISWTILIAVDLFISNLSSFGIFLMLRKSSYVNIETGIPMLQAYVQERHRMPREEEYQLVIFPCTSNSFNIALAKKTIIY